jgi:hypothetical protein
MMPLDLRHYQPQPDDEGGGVIVWLAITLALCVGIIIGSM